jgi:Fe-S oxidoreductase/nitrate reductase gamma subunit
MYPNDSAHRELYWNIGHNGFGFPQMLMYIFMLISIGFFIYGYYKRYQIWRLGQPENRFDHVGDRVKSVFIFGIAQLRILREAFPGMMHAGFFWGFIIFAIGTFLVALDADLGTRVFQGGLYIIISLLMDIFGLLSIIGVCMALYRRYVVKPDRLDNVSDDLYSLLLILGILITGFLLEAIRIAATNDPWAAWSPVGYTLSKVLSPNLGLHKGIWYVHMLLAFAFIGYLPFSKLHHIITATLNIYFRSLKQDAAVAMTPINFEDETQETFGVSSVEEYSWKNLFDTDACIRCGRCQDNCPAYLTGKPLSPKKILQDIKGALLEKAPTLIMAKENQQSPRIGFIETASVSDVKERALIGEVVTEEEIWACTTCRSCMEQCPIFVEHIPKILELRRNLVLMESNFPKEVQLTFRNMENNGNPWGISWSNRADWCKDLGVTTMAEDSDVEILFWPGCAGAFDDRSKKVATAMTKILQKAGVTFSILGTEEKCCGDSARRIGNEYLFQTLAMQNIETLISYNVKRIVTSCPHCFNTLKNEYPQFGGKFEVIHHTEFIAKLIRQGRLNIAEPLNTSITYHDSCYLGRYNHIYSAPREIMSAIPGLEVLEMDRSFETSFCCGAGGGRMWMEEVIGERINEVRTLDALKTRSKIVATACPYCLTMIEDGIKAHDTTEKVRVVDLAELVAGVIN